jgi:MFS family permease
MLDRFVMKKPSSHFGITTKRRHVTGAAHPQSSHPVARSLRSLNWLNFFVADIGTSFGPFVSVSLTEAGWSQSWIGYALSAGSISALLGQLPAGALIDHIQQKRTIAGLGMIALAAAALTIAWMPHHLPVIAALVAQSLAGVVLGPTIAAITLGLSRREVLGERFGRNMRFQALGTAVSAMLLGIVGQWFGSRAVFVAAALLALPAVLALRGIRPAALDETRAQTDHPNAASTRVRTPIVPAYDLLCHPRLLAFAFCVLLFFLGNAGIVTLAAHNFAAMDPNVAELLVPAAVVLPQALVVALSPLLGRLAQLWGQRPVLLLGFAAAPARSLLYSLGGPPELQVAWQALDGVGAAVFGVMLPVVIADITRESGRFIVSRTCLTTRCCARDEGRPFEAGL